MKGLLCSFGPGPRQKNILNRPFLFLNILSDKVLETIQGCRSWHSICELGYFRELVVFQCFPTNWPISCILVGHGAISHISVCEENTTLVRAQMGTIYLPKAKPFIHPLSEYLLSTHCVLGTVLQILVIYSNIFPSMFSRGRLLREFIQLSMSLHLGSCLGLSCKLQRSLSEPTIAFSYHALYPVSKPSASWEVILVAATAGGWLLSL